MILPLVYYPDARLRKKGTLVKAFDAKLKRLAADMLETMEAHDGVGLAAQQIGESLQFAVIDVRDVSDRPSGMVIGGKAVDPEEHMPVFLINAVVTGTKVKDSGTEGCLSFPGLHFEVARSRRVTVKTHDLDGKPFEFEATGLLAIAVQHELDHLHGKLFIDHLAPEDRAEIKEELAAIEAKHHPKG